MLKTGIDDFEVTFDPIPDEYLFVCRKCRTHIVLKRSNIFTDPVNMVGVFENGVNVKAKKDKKWRSTSRTYVEVSCVGCETVLGQQMIAVDKEDFIAKKGRYCMFMNRLIMSKTSAAVEHDYSVPPKSQVLT